MKTFSLIITIVMYLGFLGVIAFAIYISKSMLPLIGLIFMPEIEISHGDEDDKD